MMDTSGSDYEGTNESGGEDSDQVSLVEESDVGDIVLEGGGEGRSGRGTRSTREKVVRYEARTLRRKARGDDFLVGGNPLKGEKGRLVSVKGRCRLDHLVSFNKGLTEY